MQKKHTEAEIFLEEIEQFMVETGCKPTTIGRKIPNPDPALIFKLREGRSPTLTTVGKIRDFMEYYRSYVATKNKQACQASKSARTGV